MPNLLSLIAMEDAGETEKGYIEMSAGEMMGKLAQLVKDDNPLSRATISGMFRQMTEEFYHKGFDPDLAKSTTRNTLIHAALALDNCKDPEDVNTYDEALEYLNDQKQKEDPLIIHGEHFTVVQSAIAHAYF